jgi:hypothetical protein
MLFDIRGKRKRVVQVVYAALAALFLVGFVGFGIGVGGGPGGVLDAIGLGNNGGGGSVSPQFDDAINKATAKLQKNPNDTQALLRLAENEFFKAKTGITQDQTTGQISVSTDAHTDLGNSADAWQKYLNVNKGKPNATVAAEMVQDYIYLNDVKGAITAQRIVANDQPNANTLGQLAAFQYASGDISGGDATRQEALAKAPKAQRKTLESSLVSYRKQGIQVQKQEKKAKKQGAGTATTPGANPLQTPLGGAAPTTP